MVLCEAFRVVIIAYALLSSIWRKNGVVLSTSSRRFLKRNLVYHLMKRDQRRLRRLRVAGGGRRLRRCHVRTILEERKLFGAWDTLIPTLRATDRDGYFNFMRMTPECFDWLLRRLERDYPDIVKKSNREPIPSGARLAVTLRYLASGSSQEEIAYLFRMSDSVVSDIVLETTAAIFYVLRDEVFEPLSEDLWRRKAAEFEAMWQFPMCIGALDGKHVFCQKFPGRGSDHVNYKHGHSVVLFAVADAKYRFTMVDVGSKGRESDGGVFDRSEFGELFHSKRLLIPPPAFNQDIEAHLPYVFVGDAAFPFDQHLMKPFDFQIAGHPEEIVYNYRLSRARRVVENAFGILAARFRILRTNIIGSETLVQNIILACCALHNLHLQRDDSIPPKHKVYMNPDYGDVYRSHGKWKQGRYMNENKVLEAEILRSLEARESPLHPGPSAQETQERFVELFVTCPLPWQYDDLPGL